MNYCNAQGTKCRQIHSVVKEWWSFLWLQACCAHGNQVRFQRIYYHTLSQGVFGAGYSHGMQAPEGFQCTEERGVKIVL